MNKKPLICVNPDVLPHLTCFGLLLALFLIKIVLIISLALHCKLQSLYNAMFGVHMNGPCYKRIML